MRYDILPLVAFCLIFASCSESEQKTEQPVAQTDTAEVATEPHEPALAEPVVDDASARLSDIARRYKAFRRMTPQGGVPVDWQLSGLCRGVTEYDVKAAQRAHGPHAYSGINVYMNTLAAGAFEEHKSAYPPGSAIIKEKAFGSYQKSLGLSETLRPRDGVGGMIKRNPGYDPAHGDWEYFYFEDPAKIETGKISSCVTCHAGAAETDRVFGGWANWGARH